MQIIQFLVAVGVFSIGPAGNANTVEGPAWIRVNFDEHVIGPTGRGIHDDRNKAFTVLRQVRDNSGIFSNRGGKVNI